MIHKRHCWGVRVRAHQPRKQDGRLSQKRSEKDTGVLRSLKGRKLEYDKVDAHADGGVGREGQGSSSGEAHLAHYSREAPEEGFVCLLGVSRASGSEEKISIMVGGGQASRGFYLHGQLSSPGTDLRRTIYQGNEHRGLYLTSDCSEPAILFMLPP